MIAKLITDCEKSRKRLISNPLATSGDVSRELANNVYPMIKAVLEQVLEVDDVVQEVIEHTESFVQPDLAEIIFSALAAGGAIAQLVKELIEHGELDDLRKKRLLDATKTWEELAGLATLAVADAAASDDSDDDSDDDSENQEVKG